MNSTGIRRHDAWTIGLVACATFVYEVLLTRVGSLRLEFHYGYLVISLGLLALGSAGSWLHVARERVLAAPDVWLARSTAAFAISLPLTWVFVLNYPVPTHVRVFAEGGGVAWASLGAFFGFAAGAALPFFTGGFVLGLILMLRAAEADRYYAADLVGAALGCLAAPVCLAWFGGGGALCAATGLAALGARTTRGGGLLWPGIALVCLGVAPILEGRYPIPSREELMLEKGEEVALGDQRLTSEWSAIARVESYRVPEADRALFMRGRGPEPKNDHDQVFLSQDGSAGTYLYDFTGTPGGLQDLWLTTYPMATHVLGAKKVLVIGAGGAPDLWAARLAGAERIKAYELHAQMVAMHTDTYRDFSKDLIEDPGVEILHTEGRSALLREEESFDLVQMSGIDTWSALSSGAYMLAENYLYTRQAFGDMIARLEDGGALQITRFSGEVEAVRLLATIHEAWARRSNERFADCVACVHARTFMAMIVKLEPFTPDELQRLERYVSDAGLGLAYHPRIGTGSSLEAFIRSDDKASIIAGAEALITPATDDRPYFFNFHRWNAFGVASRDLDADAVVTQGNPVFLLAQLVAGVLAGALLLLFPLWLRRGKRAEPLARGALSSTLIYFIALGLGFITIEVTLMQVLVLLVGHPLYSISVTLFAMLLATGIGAAVSKKFLAAGRSFTIVPVALLILAALQFVSGDALVRAGASAPTFVRFLMAAAIVAPFGLVLGIPMAHGLRKLEASTPELVPLAWATNAFATVVGSIGTVMLSMYLGFDLTLALGAAAYVLAALAERGLGRTR
jgi:spermidine synthase